MTELELFSLELKASRECRQFGNNPHVYHCFPYGLDQQMQPKTRRELCFEIERSLIANGWTKEQIIARYHCDSWGQK